MSIIPNFDQIQAFTTAPDTGPVVMLNLLKFKPRAEGEGGSGSDAYGRYGDRVTKMIESQGGRIIWSGRPEQVLIGDPGGMWDAVVLVWYPSRKSFVEMVSTPDYQDAHRHREHGLERTVVLACTPMTDNPDRTR
jgi:uncharacterized protein (DUF1330 family)